MRLFAAALAALVVLAPRPAAACCEGTCVETERWRTLDVHGEGLVPRDGVLLFSGATGSELCIESLAPRLDVEVRRGDVVLAGQLELADGRGSSFLWRPEAPWEPGAHHVRVTIDNDAIGPPGGVEDAMSCPPECPDPSVLMLDGDFTVDAAFSPPIPAIAAPALSLAVSRLDRTMNGVTCCPGVIPHYGGECCGGCDLLWSEAGCVELYEEGTMVIEVSPHPVPPALAGQILYELRADGAVIDRQFAAERLAKFDRRQTAACVEVVALHLGNGEEVASETSCPSGQIADQLGVRPVDVAGALACAEPVRCGQPDDTWDPDACAPYDPLALPPPPAVPPDSSLVTPCPRAQGPWLSPETGGDPTTSTGTGAPGSTGGDPATAGGDGLVEHGCACEGGRSSALALLVPLLVRRRRRGG